MDEDIRPLAWTIVGGIASVAITALVVVLVAGSRSGAATGPGRISALFEDDFEDGLANWSGRAGDHHAQLVSDPLGTRGTVLHFTKTMANGDIFSTAIPVEADSVYVLSFDYLGLPATDVPRGGLGGFVGVVDAAPAPRSLAWIAGTQPDQAPNMLIDDGTWHTFTYTIVPSDFLETSGGALHLMLEDFEGSRSYAADAQPGDAYFDNVVLKRP